MPVIISDCSFDAGEVPKMDSSSDDETAMIIGAGTSALAAGYAVLEAYRTPIVIPRPPHINRDQARENYTDSILYGSSSYCIDQIRMDQDTFFRLLNTLTVRELVNLPNQSTLPEILGNQRYYPWFADCVGAIDGTHILSAVPLEIQGKFCGRPTQNVLAAISFDLKFSYVLAGWEGSAHDSRVFEYALSRPGGLQVPNDKYYLVDAGYGIHNRFIPPYIGVRYHLKEYDGNPPQNEKELFNLRHSSLRTTIYGVLMGRKGDKEFRWSKLMEHTMLQILAEEVKLGNRPNNNFRQSSFTRVVDAIKEKFGATCLPDHVKNHLRTVRASWSTIMAIRGRSGFSWIEDLKMIIASPSVYHDCIQKNPSHDKYIHKKIGFYDEMALVVGKDVVTGSFVKTFADINLGAPLTVDDAVNNITELVMQKEIPSSNASSSGTNTSSFGAKQQRKRNRSSDEIEKISKKLGEVVAALTKLSANKLDVSSLYDEIMKIKGYEEEFLALVFDHLVQNEMLAKSFIVKSDRLRLNFLEDVKKQRQT
ncbi:hypothetical protein ACH5RR_035753 [Cinchona calisaya]|uniref:DDE Tnp4 domain-containing protein n=1 Tax=Cinchona calisaya TaxID=153742 RepID=A0ABD2Y644_9GENT